MTKAESKAALVIGISLIGISVIGAMLIAPPGPEGGLLVLLAIVFIAPVGLILVVAGGVQLLLLRHATWTAAVRRHIRAIQADFASVVLTKEPKEDPEEDRRVPHLLDDRSVWDQIGRGLFPEYHEASERTIRIIWILFFVFVVTPAGILLLLVSGSLEGFVEFVGSILTRLF